MRLGFSGLGLGLNGLAGRFEGFSFAKALGLVFLFGFLVRLVPELVAYSSPIGYDTVYYAVVMKEGVVWASWGSFFTSAWLLYGLTVPLYAVTGADPFLLLKVVAPALYGLSVAGVYWFGRVLLRWDVKMCLLAAGVFAYPLLIGVFGLWFLLPFLLLYYGGTYGLLLYYWKRKDRNKKDAAPERAL
jgi:hypothetical protein